MEMGKWEIESTPIPSPRRWQYNLTGHPPPTTTQLLTMKECSDKKVPLVNMSQDDPLNPSSKKNDQVVSNNNNLWESNMIKEKVINNL